VKSRLRATLRGLWWMAMQRRIKYCFVCGGRLNRRHVPSEGRRRHVCKACGEITYVNPKVVAGLIPVMPDGRVAMLRRDIEPARGKWSYPAGYQEMGESVADAAARETWEEIRAKVRVGEMIGIYSYADAGVVTIVFEGRVLKGEKPRPGEESQNVELFSVDKLPWRDLAFRSTTDALKDWIRMSRRPRRRRTRLSRAKGVAKQRP
jgi:ADP-ribose pyrophosphatase YjhB (NUDIX family)